jgi:hypothetical protein
MAEARVNRNQIQKGPKTHQLICKEQDGFQAELPVAEVEKIFK